MKKTNDTWGRKQTTKAKQEEFTIATFNIRGLTSEIKQVALLWDINKYEIDLYCIQETKIAEYIDQGTKNGNRLMTNPDFQYY